MVFVNSAESAQVVGASASDRGEYKKTDASQCEGDRPKVEYFTSFPTNHKLQLTDTLGRDLALVDSVPQVVRHGLDAADFDKATVHLKDSTFDANLDKAAP